MSCTYESTIARPELSSNLLVPHALPYWMLICFIIHVIILLAKTNKLMQLVRTLLRSFKKSFGGFMSVVGSPFSQKKTKKKNNSSSSRNQHLLN